MNSSYNSEHCKSGDTVKWSKLKKYILEVKSG